MGNITEIAPFVKELKQAILQSQYNAAKAVNTHLVQLYYVLGAAVSKKLKQANWGDKVIDTISKELQKELKHLKGFSAENLKKMKRFYEAYPQMLDACPFAIEIMQSNEIKEDIIGSPLATKLNNSIGSPLATEIENVFWKVSFTNHIAILNKTNNINDRAWYINKTVINNWSKRVLENHLENQVHKQAELPNNFEQQLPEQTSRQAIAQFRDEYLLDFLSIDDTDDERLIENKIVQNIKDFLMNLGSGFSFMGNQYRLNVDGEEFFIDLLFYNRNLQAMVAIELKRGKFKPEYVGQIAFYLNVLDKQIRLPHENPSIGIILCKEKKNVVVEYALQGSDKPLGIATYKTINELPENYKKALPKAEELAKLLRNK